MKKSSKRAASPSESSDVVQPTEEECAQLKKEVHRRDEVAETTEFVGPEVRFNGTGLAGW
jgi:hypothetical protein